MSSLNGYIKKTFYSIPSTVDMKAFKLSIFIISKRETHLNKFGLEELWDVDDHGHGEDGGDELRNP